MDGYKEVLMFGADHNTTQAYTTILQFILNKGLGWRPIIIRISVLNVSNFILMLFTTC